MKLTASIDTTAYTKHFGFYHYGADFVSINERTYLYGLDTGIVAFIGNDRVCGNVIGIVYKDVFNHHMGQIHDVVIHYFHLATIAVQKGEPVTTTTLLGFYGNTEKYAASPHLHVEADTDIFYPQYTPTIIKGSVLRGTAQGAISYNTIGILL